MATIPPPDDGPDSAGQIILNAQIAQDDGANFIQPNTTVSYLNNEGDIVPGPEDLTDTNADNYNEDADFGTDADTREISDTQTIPPPTAEPSMPEEGLGGENNEDAANGTLAEDMAGRPVPSRSLGPFAAGDDQTNPTRSTLNNLFGANKITPKPNELSKFVSYTYSISMYILGPDEFKNMVRTKRKTVPGHQLLIQSGGAPVSSGLTTTSNVPLSFDVEEMTSALLTPQQASLGRNQFFPLDFYIEDVKLEGVLNGKGTNSAHNTTKMTFKIVEPNGISLLDNLYAATQQYVGKKTGGKQNYSAQNFLMVIRFYGYDSNGTLVKGSGTKSPDGYSDSNAIIEKFIPFQFTGIKFRIANKLTEYECEAVCPQNLIASGQARGVIPYNVELTSTSLKELLVGNASFSTVNQTGGTNGREPTSDTGPQYSAGAGRGSTAGLPQAQPEEGVMVVGENGVEGTSTVNAGSSPTQNSAPPKASSAPNPTIVSGLVNALNKYEQEKVKKGIFNVPDQYEIIITNPILESAKVIPPGQTNKKNTPMVQATSADQQALGEKQSMNTTGKTTSILAGKSIVQFIDEVTRTSSYITEQQIKIIDPVTDKETPQGVPGKIMGWYRIGLEATPIKYDEKRRDYAYKITYQLSPYAVSDVKSDYFPNSAFKGTHKKYSYWFTGENSEILDFNQDYNYLYYIVSNTKQKPPTRLVDYREYEKRAYQPRSNQNDQGIEGRVNEPGANAADYLYSPADLSRARLTIVGDPAWIQQGELWSGCAGLRFNYGPFLADGTINTESQEALFEVSFNKPVDYNLNTGIMDPGTQNYNANRQIGRAGDAKHSYVYKAVKIVSNFSRGRFTQDLEGVLVTFPVPDGLAQQIAEQNAEANQQARSTSAGTSRTRSMSGGNADEVDNSAEEYDDTYDDTLSDDTAGNELDTGDQYYDDQEPDYAEADQPPDSGGEDVGVPQDFQAEEEDGNITEEPSQIMDREY